MEGKYIVFKADEFVAACQDLRERTDYPADQILLNCRNLEDAVVIRRQDVFAPPALDGYANSITVALEMARAVEGGSEPSPLARRLQETATYFHEQAALSWDTHRKVPD